MVSRYTLFSPNFHGPLVLLPKVEELLHFISSRQINKAPRYRQYLGRGPAVRGGPDNLKITTYGRHSQAVRPFLVSSIRGEIGVSEEHWSSTQRATIRRNLIEAFDEAELRTLCADLELDHESLPGWGKAEKAQECP